VTDFIEVYERVLSAELCRDIVLRFQASPDVRPGRTGGGVDEGLKSSRDLPISEFPEWAKIVARVWRDTDQALLAYARKYPHLILGGTAPMVKDARTGKAVRIDEVFLSRLKDANLSTILYSIYRRGPLNLQCYPRRSGHYSHWHSEIYPADDECEALRRVLFLIFYLNDIDEGGATEFLYQGVRVRPTEGSLLIAPAAFTHTHRGGVPESQDKYVLATWLLFRRNEEIAR
jgi:hypothetical protein